MTGALEPVKVALVNIYTGEEIEVLANPTELQEMRRVGWTKHTVPGMSHRPTHYNGTDNASLRVNFWIDAHVAKARGGNFDVLDFANFCRSFTVPPVDETGGVADAPPRLMFVWGTLSMVCRVETLDLRFTQFDANGEPLRYDATFGLSQALDYRVSSSQLRALGDMA